MDVAYDRIQEEALPDDAAADGSKDSKAHQGGDLKTELGDAYKAFSDSSWGATLGGLWGTVRQRVRLGLAHVVVGCLDGLYADERHSRANLMLKVHARSYHQPAMRRQKGSQISSITPIAFQFNQQAKTQAQKPPKSRKGLLSPYQKPPSLYRPTSLKKPNQSYPGSATKLRYA